MPSRPIRRKQLLTSTLLRKMGFLPAAIPPTTPQVASIQAGLKLSLAAILHRHLSISKRTRRDIIANFNCSRSDGSIIVKGCSAKVWQHNFEKAMSEALAYQELAGH